MTIGFKHMHMGLGYLLLCVAVPVLLWMVVLAYRDQEPEGMAKVACTGFVALIDLQVLLGSVLFVLLGHGGAWLLKHPVFMVAAAFAAHLGNRKESWSLVGWFTASLVLLCIGVYPVAFREQGLLGSNVLPFVVSFL